MNEKTLEKICAELGSVISGQKFGKIFNLAKLQLAIDFRLPDSQYLFVSVEPSAPRIYLIKRRLRDLEKQSKNQTGFVMFLRKRLAHSVLESVVKLDNDRILRLALTAKDELGQTENYTLVAQLTGRSANILLLDKNDFVLDSCRETFGAGQETASRYAPPVRDTEVRQRTAAESFPTGEFASLSESLDAHFQKQEAEKNFQAKANAARSKIKQEISKREKLAKKLRQDLGNHGDAETWKRFGDLLLANLATAKRRGDKISVTDYYDENAPTIEIEVDENVSITDAAGKFFKRYTKARNAQTELSQRLKDLETKISELLFERERIEDAVAEKDENFLINFTGEKIEEKPTKSKDKSGENFTGARRYNSSEGFEILVGKGSKDNDFLTFRVAKSSDLWLHAADYPGSHVIVKNPNRTEIPNKTLIEAAQFAAFFSRAREQPKVAVHYTPKKFVNKPKGAGAGLVSLSSFKTILVEPKISER